MVAIIVAIGRVASVRLDGLSTLDGAGVLFGDFGCLRGRRAEDVDDIVDRVEETAALLWR